MIQETTNQTPTLPNDALASIPRPKPRPRTGLPGQRRLTRRSSIPLFAAGAADDYRTRWLEIQANFVDEPGVPQLVQGEPISTEDLRIALQHYRSFFDRLLTI